MLRQGLWKDGVRARWLSDEYAPSDPRASEAQGVLNVRAGTRTQRPFQRRFPED